MIRRDFLAGAACLAASRADAGAARIVALEWNIISILLSLGITPVGVPEIRAYVEWVVEPAIPIATFDVGLRSEPNLEAIAGLKPDLILSSPLSCLVVPLLERIAPVREVAIYTEEGAPLRLAARETRALGQLLGRGPAAEQEIAVTEDAFERIAGLVGDGSGPNLLMSFLDSRHVRVFGPSSLFGAVLSRLGLANAWTRPVNVWGFTQVGIAELATHPDARLLVIERAGFDPIRGLERASLWSNLPAVRVGRWARLPAAWFYGELSAARRFASLLPDAMAGRGRP